MVGDVIGGMLPEEVRFFLGARQYVRVGEKVPVQRRRATLVGADDEEAGPHMSGPHRHRTIVARPRRSRWDQSNSEAAASTASTVMPCIQGGCRAIPQGGSKMQSQGLQGRATRTS